MPARIEQRAHRRIRGWTFGRVTGWIALSLALASALYVLLANLRLRSALSAIDAMPEISARYGSASTWMPGVVTLRDLQVSDERGLWAVSFEELRLEFSWLSLLATNLRKEDFLDIRVRRMSARIEELRAGRLSTSGILDLEAAQLAIVPASEARVAELRGQVSLTAEHLLLVREGPERVLSLASFRANTRGGLGPSLHVDLDAETIQALEDSRWSLGKLRPKSSLKGTLELSRIGPGWKHWQVNRGEIELKDLRVPATEATWHPPIVARMKMDEGMISFDHPLLLSARVHVAGSAAAPLLDWFDLPASVEWLFSPVRTRPFTFTGDLHKREHHLIMENMRIQSGGLRAEGALRLAAGGRAMALLLQNAGTSAGLAVGADGTDFALGVDRPWLEMKKDALDLR